MIFSDMYGEHPPKRVKLEQEDKDGKLLVDTGDTPLNLDEVG